MSDVEPAEPSEPVESIEPETLHGVPVVGGPGERVLFPGRDELVTVATALFEDGYLMCLDLTAVDYLV
ncbi:MAG TPA: hypothetical protein VIJ47_11570, partial [Acidimicrobiales bacterium]